MSVAEKLLSLPSTLTRRELLNEIGLLGGVFFNVDADGFTGYVLEDSDIEEKDGQLFAC